MTGDRDPPGSAPEQQARLETNRNAPPTIP